MAGNVIPPRYPNVDAPAAPPRPAASVRAVTVADGLMALVGLAAAVLRFGELGRLPLSAAEATAALAVAAPGPPVTSPAYFTFTRLLMGLGWQTDAAARFVPAVFGLLLVLLPWLWRGRARPPVYLVAGLFLAVSPLLTAVSRTAGGDAIALFALLLLVVAGRMAVAVGGRGWAGVAGAALGLGLTSAPLFYSGLVGVVGAALVAGMFRTGDWRLNSGEWGGSSREWLRYGGLAAAVVFVAVATGLLLHPAGLGAALRLFPAWLAGFGMPSADGVLALLRYEPAILVLGLPAVVWTTTTRGRLARPPVVWLGLALAVMLLQPGMMANAAAVLLPAYLLVGLFAAALAPAPGGPDEARPGDQRVTLFMAGGLLGLGALLLAVIGRFARLGLLGGENGMLIALSTLAFALAGLAVALAMAWENPAARRGVFLGAAGLLLFWQWGTAWQLSRVGANDPRERWVTVGTDDDARVMIDLLTHLSRQTANSDHDLTIAGQVESPVLDWYLRDFPGYVSGAALPLETQADVVIAPAGVEPALPNDYFGADFGLEQRETAVAPGSAAPGSPADVLRWWLFRESSAPVETERVVVWIRADLAE